MVSSLYPPESVSSRHKIRCRTIHCQWMISLSPRTKRRVLRKETSEAGPKENHAALTDCSTSILPTNCGFGARWFGHKTERASQCTPLQAGPQIQIQTAGLQTDGGKLRFQPCSKSTGHTCSRFLQIDSTSISLFCLFVVLQLRTAHSQFGMLQLSGPPQKSHEHRCALGEIDWFPWKMRKNHQVFCGAIYFSTKTTKKDTYGHEPLGRSVSKISSGPALGARLLPRQGSAGLLSCREVSC